MKKAVPTFIETAHSNCSFVARTGIEPVLQE